MWNSMAFTSSTWTAWAVDPSAAISDSDQPLDSLDPRAAATLYDN